jgi:PadR family transcriptional regulator PadR
MYQGYVHQLLRGVIEPLLLFLIAEVPMHGYQIMKEVERRSHGYFQAKESTVYSALRRLENKGLVLSSWQQGSSKQRKRSYVITGEGRQVLAEKLAEWQRFHLASSRVIGNDGLVLSTGISG